jgi:hypothetical protein
MKVIKVKSGNSFYAVGVTLIDKSDGFSYGIVNDKHENGTEIFKGTKKKCIEYLEKLN